MKKVLRHCKQISATFLVTQNLHLLCCKSLKTNNLNVDLRLVYEGLCY